MAPKLPPIEELAMPSQTTPAITGDNPLSVLPGLRPWVLLEVPGADGQPVFLPYHTATWAELTAALSKLEDEARQAGLRLGDHQLKMDALRQYMADTPERTIAEACELMRRDQGGRLRQERWPFVLHSYEISDNFRT